MAQTLLEKAKANKKFTQFSKEELELAEAYLNQDIRLSQVGKALGGKAGLSVYIFITRAAIQLWNKK